ncbi:MAG: hypothetical protein WBY71_08735, partial [Nitrososphaeraceae archaeon]
PWNSHVNAYCSCLYRKRLDVAETMYSFSDKFNQILILLGSKQVLRLQANVTPSITVKSNSFSHSSSQP